VAVVAVARDWHSAALSMAPLRWWLDDCWLEELCHSPLRRHVSNLIFITGPASLDCMQLLSQCMAHLRGLDVALKLPLPSGVVLQFPAGLRWLDLALEFLQIFPARSRLSPKDVGEEMELAAPFNVALGAVASLTQLETLKLTVDVPRGEWFIPGSLAALARAPKLRQLHFKSGDWNVPLLSDSHVAELRALKQLRILTFNRVDTSLLGRLLASPHALQWQELGGVRYLTEDDAALLVSLPLRTLDTRLDMPHADFLLQLPQLQSLTLSETNRGPRDMERFLQALGACTQLRELTLRDDDVDELRFSSVQLRACLARLPNLSKLEIVGATDVTTLKFLAAGGLSHSLTELRLQNFSHRPPLLELQYVLQLRSLRSQTLCNVFDAPLSAADKQQINPPSGQPRLQLPQLSQFLHGWSPPVL